MRRIFPAFLLIGLLTACGGDEIPYYLFDISPMDTATGDTGGTDVGSVGCETAEHCEDGAACVDGACVISCASDDGCSGATPLCELGAGVCVECLGESNCDANQTCAQFACVSLCEENDDCPDGECVEGACVPVEAVCTPGSTTCEDNAVSTCLEDGSGYEFSPCDDGECIVSEGAASCVSSECEPFEQGCFDGQTAFQCAEDGSERIMLECETGTECDQGECVEVSVSVPTCIEVDPSRIDFGLVELGDADFRTITLAPCDEPVEIVDISFILGPDSFAITSPLSVPFILVEPIELEAEFFPESEDESYGELAIATSEGSQVVIMTGTGTEGVVECTFPDVRCAVGDGEFGTFIEIPIFSEVECTGMFTDTEVADYSWSLSEAPASSDATVPTTSAESILFEPDTAGAYVVEMNMIDTNGVAGCGPAYAEILATDGFSGDFPEVTVALTWDDGSDLDNHLKIDGSGSWRMAPDDCFWGNMMSDWGATLDFDNTEGFGPENINVSGLSESITVRAGASAENIRDASTIATMILTVDGEVQERLTAEFSVAGEFWEVWEIVIDESGVEIDTIDNVTNGYPEE
ncbi:MAG: hypothetical protein ACJAYU_002640 [Bradymonadia bacterium]|jgi:hypothetical protein